ncbi:unnamed protein product [Allacma fusca]|uniref:Uncharacterized protein n=1 Tax=Allacma fusca TaxID=39272 RepID=A0A8J2KTB4_9HEXA|nr:unnamed protein product [Allacma fusca]
MDSSSELFDDWFDIVANANQEVEEQGTVGARSIQHSSQLSALSSFDPETLFPELGIFGARDAQLTASMITAWADILENANLPRQKSFAVLKTPKHHLDIAFRPRVFGPEMPKFVVDIATEGKLLLWPQNYHALNISRGLLHGRLGRPGQPLPQPARHLRSAGPAEIDGLPEKVRKSGSGDHMKNSEFRANIRPKPKDERKRNNAPTWGKHRRGEPKVYSLRNKK